VTKHYNLFFNLAFPNKVPTKQQIKNLILKVSDLFTNLEAERPADYMNSKEVLTGYLIYFVPVNLSKIYNIFKELAMHNKFLKKNELRIIDLGCGPSPAVVPIFDLIEEGKLRINHIRYAGIDSEEKALKIGEKIVQKTKPEKVSIKAEFIKGDLLDLSLYKTLRDIKPDIIIFSNSLGEIFDKRGINIDEFINLIKPFTYKNPDLTLILIEPGTKKASMRLHEIRDNLIEKLNFYPYSPCLNNLPCSALKAKNWCYEERKWSPPEYLVFLSSVGLQINYLKFSYVVLRRDKANISDIFDTDGHIIKNTSHLLNEKGKVRLWACWNGKLIDMEKLKRDLNEDDNWLKIKKGTYFSVEGVIFLSDKKVRIPKDSEIKILYEP